MKIYIYGVLFSLGITLHLPAYADGFQYWMHVADDTKVDSYNDNRISFDGQDPVAVILAYYSSENRKNRYWQFIYTDDSERKLSPSEVKRNPSGLA